jgi:NCS1 family nucleobase:cation symporter-1
MTVHVALHKIFPAENQTGASPFEMELHRSRRVDGERPQGYVESMTSHEDETVVVGEEKNGSV